MAADSQEKLIDPDKPKPADKRRAAVDAWQEAREPNKQQNKAKGHTKQKNKRIDIYRATDGKVDYNAMRKAERLEKAMAEGRPFRPRAPRGQTSPDAKSGAERSADLRAAMTVKQKQNESKKRQERRQRAKDKIAAALKDAAIFS